MLARVNPRRTGGLWIFLGIALLFGGSIIRPRWGMVLAAGESSDTGLPNLEPPATQAPDLEDPFRGWELPEKPRAVLFLSGRQYGYIEPCGCTGLANQKGGLARRFSLLSILRHEKGWPIVPLDVGNQVRRYGKQAEIQFSATIDALRAMQYEAVGLGPDDLRLSVGDLVSVVVGEGTSQGAPFVCANVNILGMIEKRFHVVEKNGVRIGITAVLGDTYAHEVNSPEIEKQSIGKSLPGVLHEMRKQNCHVTVMLAHATDEESEELARKYPDFQLVVTSAGAGEPANQIRAVEGARGRMIQVGTKGMYVGVVGIYGEPGQLKVRYARVPLDARYPDAPPMMNSLAAYQLQLKTEGLKRLGLEPIPHPTGRKFVGSDACAECHEAEYEKWKQTPHAHATESLHTPKERSHVPRHHDPECLSCHVTGWNPQEFFPYVTGYLDFEKSRAMHGNGCENCHGPGASHVAAESGALKATESQKKALQTQMHAELHADTCLSCHDLDNSPDFHAPGALEKYWGKIAH
ncbi:MAG: multiheme c-type cytochrome [Planctomycetota bacterium]|nr:multiheme c-type cytochrome [Planctomycetota bacterium]